MCVQTFVKINISYFDKCIYRKHFPQCENLHVNALTALNIGRTLNNISNALKPDVDLRM